MSKYDSSGRRYVDVSFLGLSNIPTLVSQLGALSDPATDAYLMWDDSSGTLVWSEVTSLAPYAGFCDAHLGASVTIKTNPLASGWTVSQQATGRFRITHSLGLSSVTDLSIVPAARLTAGGTNDRYCLITNENANYFEVLVNDVGSGAVDDDFYFQAVRLV